MADSEVYPSSKDVETLAMNMNKGQMGEVEWIGVLPQVLMSNLVIRAISSDLNRPAHTVAHRQIAASTQP